jgi:hypothetical protein
MIHVGNEQAGPKVAAAPNQTARGRSIAAVAVRCRAMRRSSSPHRVPPRIFLWDRLSRTPFAAAYRIEAARRNADQKDKTVTSLGRRWRVEASRPRCPVGSHESITTDILAFSCLLLLVRRTAARGIGACVVDRGVAFLNNPPRTRTLISSGRSAFSTTYGHWNLTRRRSTRTADKRVGLPAQASYRKSPQHPFDPGVAIRPLRTYARAGLSAAARLALNGSK